MDQMSAALRSCFICLIPQLAEGSSPNGQQQGVLPPATTIREVEVNPRDLSEPAPQIPFGDGSHRESNLMVNIYVQMCMF